MKKNYNKKMKNNCEIYNFNAFPGSPILVTFRALYYVYRYPVVKMDPGLSAYLHRNVLYEADTGQPAPSLYTKGLSSQKATRHTIDSNNGWSHTQTHFSMHIAYTSINMVHTHALTSLPLTPETGPQSLAEG